jgi:3-methyladenine DNA glycosylase AlkC
MSNRNRSAGHSYERTIVKELKELGFDVVTARSESRNMDNKKVDVFSPLGVDNSLPFYVQCKNSKSRPNYHKILNEMPDDRVPIILHRQTHKVNTKFVTDGDYVIMKKEDFYNLIK